jgi:hypothetical protein
VSHDQQALKIDIYSFAYTLPLCRITGRFVKNRHHFLFGDLGGYVSWCDKLASRPTVGFSFNKHFRPSSELLSAIVPVLDQLAGPITDKFSISKQETFSVELATESGFKYNIDPSRVAVEFQHRMQVKNTSGGMPTVEMLSKQEPYTIMLAEVGKRALEAAELLMGAGSNRMLERVGVVSTTIVDEADAPPGIKRGIEYLCKPWGKRVEHYAFQVVAFTDETDEWDDRCIHTISKPESDEGFLTLQFDYQRKLKNKKGISSARAALTAVQEAALSYFEALAQGDMFDANDDTASE